MQGVPSATQSQWLGHGSEHQKDYLQKWSGGSFHILIATHSHLALTCDTDFILIPDVNEVYKPRNTVKDVKDKQKQTDFRAETGSKTVVYSKFTC